MPIILQKSCPLEGLVVSTSGQDAQPTPFHEAVRAVSMDTSFDGDGIYTRSRHSDIPASFSAGDAVFSSENSTNTWIVVPRQIGWWVHVTTVIVVA